MMEKKTEISLRQAFDYCTRLARTHYENFPVASMLMPRALRPHVAAVYAFARHADDLADEGCASPEDRRRNLEEWRAQLSAVEQGNENENENEQVHEHEHEHEQEQEHGHENENENENEQVHEHEHGGRHPVFVALGETIRRYDIPPQLFHDLLDAFVQDTWKERYGTFDELLDYCRRSANPVGRIILALFGRLDERTAPLSDALCTGLQLVNFWQDVSVDRMKPRLYIPEEDLARYSLSPDDILHGVDSHATRTVIAFEVERTKEYFRAALPLFPLVPLRLRLELSAIWRGGFRVLEKIEKQRYTVVQSRPALSVMDMVSVFSGTVLKGSPHAGF